MKKIWLDYETETGRTTLFAKGNFNVRNWVSNIMEFPFVPIDTGYSKYFDAYRPKDKKIKDAVVLIVGGKDHCYGKSKKPKYDEGVAINCYEKDKLNIIREVSKII